MREMIKIKRIYDPPASGDGKRILIDRLWPRGLKKEDAKIDEWLRELAPSTELRKWFGHDPEKWVEFKRRFFSELRGRRDLADNIAKTARKGTVTLLFASKEERFNNAAAVKEFIETGAGASEKKKAS
jgi:uncharacterized protein YeaO (DUF488 family)